MKKTACDNCGIDLVEPLPATFTGDFQEPDGPVISVRVALARRLTADGSACEGAELCPKCAIRALSRVAAEAGLHEAVPHDPPPTEEA